MNRADELPHRYTAAYANALEERWQAALASADEQGYGLRQPNPGEPGFDASKPKFYCLDMFPYPSGEGLHVGHALGYAATDILCRYKRLKGFNVLHPMGWDAFGLPAEQYAIQTGVHPEVTTRKAINNYRRQLRRLGFLYDWSREFATVDPGYYRWSQWIWLQAYSSWFDPAHGKARPIAELETQLALQDTEIPAHDGSAKKWSACTRRERQVHLDNFRLAYRGKQPVNWCPRLGTVLANEEVIDGRSERGGFPVKRIPLEQWMFRITAYADRLLDDLRLVDWPEETKARQVEWIGRSEGAEIRFAMEGGAGGLITVFTTRPETLFGATYLVVAPEHPLVGQAIARDPGNTRLSGYAEWAINRPDSDRQTGKAKTGCATGLAAIHPATGERIPIWTADYVLTGYGTGAIMAVPAHDERDFEFARAFDLPIVPVIDIAGNPFTGSAATCGEGRAINSAHASITLDGLATADARKAVVAWLEREGIGGRRVTYRLRDWLFSRQRYWGEPFPIVLDAEGNHYPVSTSHLPVLLPSLNEYSPIEADTPQPPLSRAHDWSQTTAGAAGVDPAHLPADTPVVRETNTMPGWAGSCWYYLRFCSPKDQAHFVSPEAERYWMLPAGQFEHPGNGTSPAQGGPGAGHPGGVDLYVGGREHAVRHCLYARFWHKMLHDLGLVSTPEPFGRLFHQGLITSFAFQRADQSLVPADRVDEVCEGEFLESSTGERVTRITAKMSKSLRNVVNPDEVIAEYGADTVRLYEMYMGPLGTPKPWNTRDIAGVFRFLQRFWRLAVDERTGKLLLATLPDPEIEKLLHRTIHQVGEDIEKLSFNTAIAVLIEFVNRATRPQPSGGPADGVLTRDQLARLATVLWPFAPHLADEIGAKLGLTATTDEGLGVGLARQSWPAVNPAMLVDDQVELPVQVGGRIKAGLLVPPLVDVADLEKLALAHPAVVAAIAGRTVKRLVVIPGRLVNVVV